MCAAAAASNTDEVVLVVAVVVVTADDTALEPVFINAREANDVAVVVDDVGGDFKVGGLISSIFINCSMGIKDNSPPGCGNGGNFAKAFTISEKRVKIS